MKSTAVFALPLAVAGLLGATTITANASEAHAQISGIITGEVLCALYRQGVDPDVATAEAQRLTAQFLRQGNLKPEHSAAYKRTVKAVFDACPEPAIPDA